VPLLQIALLARCGWLGLPNLRRGQLRTEFNSFPALTTPAFLCFDLLLLLLLQTALLVHLGSAGAATSALRAATHLFQICPTLTSPVTPCFSLLLLLQIALLAHLGSAGAATSALRAATKLPGALAVARPALTA
jgi:hypothetical protein